MGTSEANLPQDIQLSGSHILKEHCTFENRSGVVTLIPHKDALVYLNGRKLVEPEVLNTGSRVILGKNHVFRFTHPEQAREIREKVTEVPECIDEVPDWNFAKCELLEKQGIDLKAEMQKRLVVLEEQYKREKLQADQEFEEQRKSYEARIDALQKQVEEQSMTMSMYSSYSPEDFHPEEDIFGEQNKFWSTIDDIRKHYDSLFIPEFNFQFQLIHCLNHAGRLERLVSLLGLSANGVTISSLHCEMIFGAMPFS